MRVILVHNPSAGCSDHDDRELVAAIEDAGHRVKYCSTDDDGWERCLQEKCDLICAAGGDGTVDKVATRLAGHAPPLAVIPLGTANNIARSLGYSDDPRTCVAGWQHGRLKPYDVGVIRGPFDELRFVECAGVGLFPQLMPILAALHEDESFANEEEKMAHELKSLRGLLTRCHARPWTLKLDGRDVSGEFLMVEVMNIGRLGPGLHLAPGADPGDGYFDVVTVTGDEQPLLEQYLEACQHDRETLPGFTTRRARRVQIEWEGSEGHADSELWAQGNRIFASVKTADYPPPVMLDIQLMPGALQFLWPPRREAP